MNKRITAAADLTANLGERLGARAVLRQQGSRFSVEFPDLSLDDAETLLAELDYRVPTLDELANERRCEAMRRRTKTA